MLRASNAGEAPVLDVLDADAPLPDRCQVRAWRPDLPGISEVFHAEIVDYGYPLHAHDAWTVLIIDAGAIRYDLDTRHCAITGNEYVAVLPPGIVHDGRPAGNAPGFRKRNLYLDASFLPDRLIGAAVDKTTLRDGDLRTALAQLHRNPKSGHETGLQSSFDLLDAEARLALIGERLCDHLTRTRAPGRKSEPAIAARLRLLLDDGAVPFVTLADASRLLDRSVPHLVRSFTDAFGVSPHAYLIGRRIDAARRLLLTGAAPAEVATQVGFYDQAHLTRHFRRHTSTTPAAYARSHI